MPEMTMTPDRWELVMRWFAQAVTTDGAARQALLEEAARADPDLRRELEALLEADSAAGEFLEQPAPEMLAEQTTAILPSWQGKRVGPYLLTQKIGQGGMGVVYLAERADGAYQQTVALKLIRHGFESEETQRRFRLERQILARLEHPHIARLLDGGTTEDGRPWLAMEYIEGEPITTYCAQRRLAIDERLRLFQSVCSAVQYSHQHFIIHRDLKPGNLLVTKAGVPKLLDFGIARLLEPDPLAPEDLPTTKQRLLTPDYASPEQVRGESLNVTSDVYSLGVVLYELLTGARPTPFSLHAESRSPERPSLAVRHRDSSTSRTLRGDLDDILLKALRPEPQHRYASVEQFSEDIQRYLDRLPVLARKGSLAYRTAKLLRRHRAAIASAALVFLSLCLGLIVTTWQARVAQAAQHKAEAERNNAETHRQRAEAALLKAEAERQRAEQATKQAFTQKQRAEQERQRATAALASAQQERARAERRFNDVHKLANAMLFDVHDEIAELTGATKARSLLVNLAQEYLDSLASEAGNDLSLQHDLARAYVKLGDAQGNARAGELGDKPAALASYRRAFAIQKKLVQANGESPQARYELALNHSKLAEAREALEQRKEAIAEARTSLNLLAALRAENPEDARFFHACFYQHHQLADLFRKAGETVLAQEHTREAITLMEPHLQKATTTETGETLYNDHQRFALMLRERGDLEGALRHYRQALDLARATATQTPNNFNANYVQSDIHRGIAITLTRQKDFRRAAEQYLQGHEIMASLAQRDPANVRLRHRLSQSHGNIADVFAAAGDVDKAHEHLRQAVALEELLMTQVPSRFPINFADRLKALADLVRTKGDYVEAIKHYEGALRLMEPMVVQNPNDPLARRRLGVYLGHIGACRLKLGETEAAEESLRKMLQLREELRAADRESPTFQSDLAFAYCLMGDLSAQQASAAEAERLTHWREARGWYQKGLELFQNLRQRGLLSGGPAAKPEEVIREIAKCDAALAQLQTGSTSPR
jgi:tetratricopeptide (TPR) repeat protein